MKKWMTLNFIMLFVFSSLILFAQERKELHKTFDAKKRVRVETTSGDCIILSGSDNEIKVDLVYAVEPEDAFEPDIQERTNEIRIKERWRSRSSGQVSWTITVPKETEIDFSTASGDLSIEGVHEEIEASTASGDITILDTEGRLDVSTASGDIEISDSGGEMDLSTASGDIKARDINGEMDLSTASGDIRIKNSKGEFEISCASGDIEASEIVLTEEGSFSTASGDIELKLAESAEYDIECSAASGDIELDYQGNNLNGYFEFTTRKNRGSIRSGINFDTEEEFERGGRTYIRKTVSVGGKTPQILLSTSSGDITFRE
jgi:DUF4097 and DUF4098 domain-containing protein YvlB